MKKYTQFLKENWKDILKVVIFIAAVLLIMKACGADFSDTYHR